MKVKINIDRDKCTRCGFCVDACPVECFVFDEDNEMVIVKNEELCLVCRNCEEESAHDGCVIVNFPY